MENERVAAVVANAQSGKTFYNYFEVAMLCCARLIEFSAVDHDESGGAGGVVLGESKGMSWRGLRRRGRGLGRERGPARPPGPACN